MKKLKEEHRKKISESMKKSNKVTGFASTKEKEINRRLNISKSMKRNPKAGGYRIGSGRGKSGWYKGYWCDSSWELAWVIYNLENGIKFERNKIGFEYEFENEIHSYLPDFFLINEKCYIEIKGYKTKKTEAKFKAFTEPLIVLYERDLSYIFDYVKNKYGCDYIELYDNSPYENIKCKDCENKICRENKTGYCKNCIKKNGCGRKKTKFYNCIKCGKDLKKRRKTKLCNVCLKIESRTIKRPPYEKLKIEIEEVGYSATGRKYGVSDTSIRKWIKYYENNN